MHYYYFSHQGNVKNLHMGILLEKQSEDLHIGVWEITESIDELRTLAKDSDDSHLNLEKRKKEFLSTRLLLQHMIQIKEIDYNKDGSPKINHKKEISISHSDNLSCIILSEKRNGIDIQTIKRKSLNISSKFINPHHIKDLTKEKATLIWTMKESIFKWHKIKSVNFKEDIIIPEFKIEKQGCVITEFKGDHIRCNYLKIQDKYLSYVCN